MRRRIVAVALATAALAVALFAVPLGLAVHRLYVTDEAGEMERAALTAAVAVGPDFAAGDPAELPQPESGSELGLYDRTGALVSGTGPAQADAATQVALAGGVGQSDVSGWVVVSVPVSTNEVVVGAVRSAAPSSDMWRRTVATWFGMLLVGLLAIGIAVLAARVLARRVARPLDELAAVSQALGDGDFTVRVKPTGMPETDRAGTALNLTAQRLDDLVSRERQVAANTSHQLRTPLTGLRATLEDALANPERDLAAAARKAIESADRLEVIIDDLIALTRGTNDRSDPVDLVPHLRSAEARWRGPLAERGRPLRVLHADDLSPVLLPGSALDQILDVLVENALVHGTGTVTIVARTTGTAVAIDVADQGHDIDPDIDIFARGVSGAEGAGIGLALARSIVEDHGGRLRLSQRQPATQFTVLLTT